MGDGVWCVRDGPAAVFEELTGLACAGVDGGAPAVVFEEFACTTVLISSIGADWSVYEDSPLSSPSRQMRAMIVSRSGSPKDTLRGDATLLEASLKRCSGFLPARRSSIFALCSALSAGRYCFSESSLCKSEAMIQATLGDLDLRGRKCGVSSSLSVSLMEMMCRAPGNEGGGWWCRIRGVATDIGSVPGSGGSWLKAATSDRMCGSMASALAYTSGRGGILEPMETDRDRCQLGSNESQV